MSAISRPGRQPLLVTGMHRSGTSLVMRVLEALGVDLGSAATLFPADAIDNPDGYQEHRPIVEIDDELLRLRGGHASEPPSPAAGWQGDPAIVPVAQRAAVVLRTTFSTEPWAFKDPRSALLIPFWKLVRPDLRFVVCVRNPLEVAESMLRRGGPYSCEHWLAAWVRHTAAAIEGSAGSERTFVLFDDLLATPGTSVDELAMFVHGGPPDLAVRERAVAAISVSRRRSVSSDRGLTDDPRVPRSVARYYFAVRELARAQQRSRIAAAVR